MRLSERTFLLMNALDLQAASGVEGARWEHFQIAHLSDNSTFRIEDKSRQIAWSFLTAAEAMAEAILYNQDSVFVSINLEEAKEKIRYASSVYENLTILDKPKLVRQSTFNLELATGARLTSLPARAPRGRARANVYLDEFAHVQDADKIYTATLPIISKGGRLRMASSPFGAQGKFWEVYTQSMQRYPGFARKSTPWWEVESFCKNVEQARLQAPGMMTLDAVEVFGNERIQTIFQNMVLEDFEQEYCCIFVDGSLAWISYQEIQDAQQAKLDHIKVICRGKDKLAGLVAIDELRRLVDTGKLEPVFAAGLDIGRRHDLSVLTLVGIDHETGERPMRLTIHMQGMEFDDQFEMIATAMNQLPIVRLAIDRTGLGMQLAENAIKLFPDRAVSMAFTNPTKIMLATEAKKLIQQKRTPLPVDRDLSYQIHSIKRIATGNTLRFDSERDEKGHADWFWAWALALIAAKQVAVEPMESQVSSISLRTFA